MLIVMVKLNLYYSFKFFEYLDKANNVANEKKKTFIDW